uniref:protein quaking-B-like isoform X3 n=1 Tax=Myxine glutinosa TaxID=7769 RepID=UPI00358EF9DF
MDGAHIDASPCLRNTRMAVCSWAEIPPQGRQLREMVGSRTVNPRSGADYLAQLLQERRLLSTLPQLCGALAHIDRLLDEEIGRVRKAMYSDWVPGEKATVSLPDPVGPVVQLQEKLYVPTQEYPDFNFVGRILGPRGLTAKQLETETGAKIMVRGRGSMRDKKKEEQNRGKPNWEHLDEDLHVLVTVEDTQNRASLRLALATSEVRKLLVPAAEGEDNLKKVQLMELAILNGTYRDSHVRTPLTLSLTPTPPRLLTSPSPFLPHPHLRAAPLPSPQPQAPTALLPLLRPLHHTPGGLAAALPPTGHPHEGGSSAGAGGLSLGAGVLYAPYDYPYAIAPATSILEYPLEPGTVLGMTFPTKS